MPTRNEAFGLVYQEAAAAGLPAIGSRLNAVPEIVEDGDTGLLVDAGGCRRVSSRRWSGSSRRLSCRDRLGRAARAKIESRRIPEVHRARLVALITQVASIKQGTGHG